MHVHSCLEYTILFAIAPMHEVQAGDSFVITLTDNPASAGLTRATNLDEAIQAPEHVGQADPFTSTTLRGEEDWHMMQKMTTQIL